MEIKTAIAELLKVRHLNASAMESVMRTIMQGLATPAQIAAFLVALRLKGETVEELTAAATVMREMATPVTLAPGKEPALDVVGTGGDGAGLFNVSTASAIVVSATGLAVAKHGNRSVSSKSGSADLLEAAGLPIDLTATEVAASVSKTNFGFMFAPNYHSAMKHVMVPRRDIGARTLFNLLGPLTNPARVTHHLIGVYDPHWLEPMAIALQRMGSQRALLVHAEDGLDEISIAARTECVQLTPAGIERFYINPKEWGITHATLDGLHVANAKESLALLHQVLENQPGAATDMCCLNAGAALWIGERANTIEQGIACARDHLKNGKALAKFKEIIDYGQQLVRAR